MPRERKFYEPEVLDRLTDVFSTHGYVGTSLTLLEEATSLGKQSLYNTFGGKHAMYLQAIDCAAQRRAGVSATMQLAPHGRAALACFFDDTVECCASEDVAMRSCIVTNGLLEGVDDAGIALALTRKWNTTHEALRSEVERGQRDGSIQSTLPSAELAEVLIALISGLRVAARAGRSRTQMERLVAMTLGVLDRN